MNDACVPDVVEIAIDQIRINNPRSRNPTVFQEIVDSISKIGLKRPITVRRKRKTDGKIQYDLVCGQGRLEAFRLLGEKRIPAIVTDVSHEDALVMSLAENIARRNPKPLELLKDIELLLQRGYTHKEIADKTGLCCSYTRDIAQLLKRGEDRLISGVETGQLPMGLAIKIAQSDDENVQAAVTEAYKCGALRGKKLLSAKRVVEARERRGKSFRKQKKFKFSRPLTTKALVEAYEKEAEKQRMMVKRATMTQGRLTFAIEALRLLRQDEKFINLLREEGLEKLPKPILQIIEGGAGDTR